jgi:hypothetical protein
MKSRHQPFACSFLSGCLSLALLFPASALACIGNPSRVIATETCTISVDPRLPTSLKQQLKKAPVNCKFSDEDIANLLVLLTDSYHVKVFDEAEYQRLSGEIESAKERNCGEFKIIRRGKWLGYTTPHGTYDAESGQCMVARC